MKIFSLPIDSIFSSGRLNRYVIDVEGICDLGLEWRGKEFRRCFAARSL